MMKHIKYFSYVLKHKWYVLIECFKRGLYWRGLTHDLSKFLPSEFFPYSNHFKGNIKAGRNKSGYYKPTNTGDAKFDLALFKHLKRNSHHWQYWCMPNDIEGVVTFDIPEIDKIEMLCDWIGAGKAQGYITPSNDPLYNVKIWWKENGYKLQLHPNTKKYFDTLLKTE